MKLNVKLIDKIVGLFILIAILGLVAIFVFLGLNQRWFKKNYYFISIYKSANNISPGMKITLKGFEIGKVDKIELDPEKKNVKMHFYIYEEYYSKVVYKNSIIELVSSPIGLGSSLIFHPGIDTKLLEPEGSLIPAYSSEEGMKRVSLGLVDRTQSDDSIGAILAQVNPILQQIPPVLYTAKTLMLDLDEAIKGSKTSQLGLILTDAGKIISSVQNTLHTVDAALKGTDQGPLGNTLNNVSAVSNNLTTIMQNANNVIVQANGTLTHVGKIMDQVKDIIEHETANVDKLMADLKGTTSNIEKLTADPTGLVVRLLDPKGSLKTFLDDDNKLFNTVSRNLEDLLAKVNRIIGQLEEFARFVTGTAPQISGLLEEGKEALNKGQDVLEGLTNNPLLKGGITEKRTQPSTYNSYRDEEF